MSEKSGYKTKQREELLEYLETVPGVHITVNDVCDHFHQSGRAIGTTTVYRQLERMVDEGLVSKYIIDGNSPACFEYLGAHVHRDSEVCFHCKCEKCGKLIHMHCDELKGIQEHLAGEHGFHLNPMRTVFYGVCEDCAQHMEENVT
ncbi:MAG: transcriptional repressor [Lachnospiraceae bacterium]|nr:transcriptional repressor [Lachnospiraceae bacterium]